MGYPKEWDQLSKNERRRNIKALQRQKDKRQALMNKLRNWSIGLIVIAIVAVGGYFWLINREVLPPTSFLGHIESAPLSHISDQPMLITVQKHMLEHADGAGPPGVVINYNCIDFECESDLVRQLTEIAQQFPEFVYLAPYPDMTKKIAITRQGRIETFDSFDKEGLVSFIERR